MKFAFDWNPRIRVFLDPSYSRFPGPLKFTAPATPHRCAPHGAGDRSLSRGDSGRSRMQIVALDFSGVTTCTALTHLLQRLNEPNINPPTPPLGCKKPPPPNSGPGSCDGQGPNPAPPPLPAVPERTSKMRPTLFLSLLLDMKK